MRTEKLSYDLPPELIAQEPLKVRSDSRLLVLNRSTGGILDSRFSSLGDFLSSGDCLVLNDTKVVPARFFARRATGARLEGLFLSEDADGIWTVYLKGTRRLKTGDAIFLKDRHKADFCEAVLLEKADEGRCRLKLRDFRSTIFDFQFSIGNRQPTIGNRLIRDSTVSILNSIGFPPLPPYIKRDDDPALAAIDKSRYQTVYARYAGAVAAPTAGLHFTESLIEQVKQAGIHFAFITLHVGAGTFKPITAENIEDHKIHQEQFSIDEEDAGIINTARNKGGRIIPVGTTSTRVLETAARQASATMDDGRKDEGRSVIHTLGTSRTSSIEYRVSSIEDGTTELFITPGYEFKITDALITNFHLPRSSLLALVAAFAGLDRILAAYHHAIEQRYRFYSYGDAMLII
jgi:S-adenosylmethionine:tRNA ribosyltransferase-isomerase